MKKPVRRVVTGLNPDGRSCVLTDDITSGFLWSTNAMPGSHAGIAGGGGTRFLVSESAPRASHGGWHATDTVDYVAVLEGEVVLGLDTDDVILRAGDTVIQGGVLHAWRNDTDAPARIVVVMIDMVSAGAGSRT